MKQLGETQYREGATGIAEDGYSHSGNAAKEEGEAGGSSNRNGKVALGQ